MHVCVYIYNEIRLKVKTTKHSNTHIVKKVEIMPTGKREFSEVIHKIFVIWLS